MIDYCRYADGDMVVSEKIKDKSHYCISCSSIFPQQNIKTEVKGACGINKKMV